MENNLEYRMYGLVPYNLSPIQQGIQFGHAVVEYGRAVNGVPPFEKIYNKWADNDKTFIILNGGTTNNNLQKLGSLNQHMANFSNNGILFASFNEPDLGDQLTAFVFLVDERVWNKEKYPDFIPVDYSSVSPSEKIEFEREKKWNESIGGYTNIWLRDYLKNLRLA